MHPRFVLCLLPSALVALLLLSACSPNSSVSIQDEYDDRIVYTTDAGADVEQLREHCTAQGGEFDECGSPCAPDAEACIEVCAFVCYTEDAERMTE